MSLFPQPAPPTAHAPLAERMRPATLDEILGQEHLLAPGKPLRTQIERDDLSSMILWGPPGCGKTTLARLIATLTRADFLPFSAVMAGIKEIKDVMAVAERARRATGRRTIVFVDEVHRFNKAQQDAFLPRVEAGDVLLIGATTENPSFEVIAPLLSRVKVHVLKQLEPAHIVALLRRGLSDAGRGLGREKIEIADALLERIAVFSNGDARAALNTLEACFLGSVADAEDARNITAQLLEDVLQRKMPLYDKSGEEHFNLISALHKSVRNSDPDAALYWFARMIESGEDPLYIARRLIRMASEDVGLADPQALPITLAAREAFDTTGPPEGYLPLAEAVVYLSLAPKSNALYVAYGEAVADVQERTNEPVPLHLRGAVTGLMRNLGYGRGYEYAHDYEEKTTAMQCLPDGLKERRYYRPTSQGLEARMAARMEELRRLKSSSTPAPTSAKKDAAAAAGSAADASKQT